MSLEIPLSEQEHLQQLRKVNKFVNSIDKSESYIRAAIKVSGRNILKSAEYQRKESQDQVEEKHQGSRLPDSVFYEKELQIRSEKQLKK